MDYDMTHNVVGQCSIRPSATFGRPRCGSSLAVSLPSPRLCRPEPALAETLALHLLRLSLCYRHHPGAVPAVTPHPDVHWHLVEPAAVARIPLCVRRGAAKTPIILEAAWDSGVTVAEDEALNERGTPHHVCYRANAEAGQARVAANLLAES
jgi:hypothetical protein